MTMNLSYLRDIYGHTHIVRFIFFLVDKNKSSEESSILWSCTYKKLADKNYSCDMIYLQRKVGQLFSADNIGQLLSVVCHVL